MTRPPGATPHGPPLATVRRAPAVLGRDGQLYGVPLLPASTLLHCGDFPCLSAADWERLAEPLARADHLLQDRMGQAVLQLVLRLPPRAQPDLLERLRTAFPRGAGQRPANLAVLEALAQLDAGVHARFLELEPQTYRKFINMLRRGMQGCPDAGAALAAVALFAELTADSLRAPFAAIGSPRAAQIWALMVTASRLDAELPRATVAEVFLELAALCCSGEPPDFTPLAAVFAGVAPQGVAVLAASLRRPSVALLSAAALHKLLRLLAGSPPSGRARLAETLADADLLAWPENLLTRLATALERRPEASCMQLVEALEPLGRSILHTWRALVFDLARARRDTQTTSLIQALPQDAVAPVLRGIDGMDAAQRAHLVDCVLRLLQGCAQQRKRQFGSSCGGLDQIAGIYERELLLTHLTTLQIDGASRSTDVHAALDILKNVPAAHRAALVAAAKKLITPSIRPDWRHAILSQLAQFAPGEMEEFVGRCRVDAYGAPRPQPSVYDLRTVALEMKAGRPYRPRRDAQNVHERSLAQRTGVSIENLLDMVPEAIDLPACIDDVLVYLAGLERETPRSSRLHRRQPYQARTPFGEARFALIGETGDGYPSFAASGEVYATARYGNVPVGEMAAKIWRAIDRYPRDALLPPNSEAQAARERDNMRYHYVMALADCIEDGRRICYAGKAVRILQPLQGMVQGIAIDPVEGEALPEVAPQQLLSLLAQEAFGDDDDPTVAAVHQFLGKAVALGEAQWPAPDSPARDTYLRELRAYVAYTFGAMDGQLPDF